MANNGWVAIDLDGTLACYDGFKGPGIIGEPIPRMVRRVKQFLAEGQEVRIFTARVYSDGTPARTAEARIAYEAILTWTEKNIGVPLKATCTKDYGMWVLYDDRAKQVVPNTGRVIGDDNALIAPDNPVEAMRRAMAGIHWKPSEAEQLKQMIDQQTEIKRAF
jgi:hypothetical protein